MARSAEAVARHSKKAGIIPHRITETSLATEIDAPPGLPEIYSSP